MERIFLLIVSLFWYVQSFAQCSVNAGPNQTICGTRSIVLSGSVTSGSTATWSSVGGGTFADPHSLNTTYTPSANERSAGYCDLYLTSDSGSPCGSSVQDNTIIIFQYNHVNAGVDQSICTNQQTTVKLSGYVNFNTPPAWTTSGSGTFSDPNTLYPEYYPSASDLSSDTIMLVLSSTDSSCPGMDTMIVSYITMINANAGKDTTICSGNPVMLGESPVADFLYSWSSNPSGMSSTSSEVAVVPNVNTSYFLTISKDICTSKDTVVITVNNYPTVNAGPDNAICPNTKAHIGSSGDASATYSWSSIPSGFNSSSALDSVLPPAGTSVTYILNGTSNGCSLTDTVVITVHSEINPTLSRVGDSLFSSPAAYTGDWLKNGAYDNDIIPYYYNTSVYDKIRIYMPGAYQVISTDDYGCKDTSGIFNVANKKMGGMIRKADKQGLANATVYLFSLYHYPNTDSLIVDSTVYTDANGYYTINSFLTNINIAVFPDKTIHPDLVPTYYPGALVFQDAQKVDVSSNTDSLNFTVLSGVNPGGSGLFYGTVDQLSSVVTPALKIASQPATDVRMILVDVNGNAVEEINTDYSGNFQFTNLPYGTFKIWIDMPGLDNSLAPEITLSSTNASITNTQFNLHNTYLEKVSGVSGVASATSLNSFELYPNPVKDNFIINTEVTTDVNYSLINSTGKVVKEGKVNCPATISVPELERGVYVIRTVSEEKVTVNKIVLE